MIAYITKYALTKGILEVEGEVEGKGEVIGGYNTPMFSAKKMGYFYGGEYHLNINDAKAKAESMRIKKVDSLRKQIARLESMSFAVVK